MYKLSQSPRHVAIIMDGNRRWAKMHHKPAIIGHRKGAERLEEILMTSIGLGIEAITVYGFSTENWKRSEVEVKGLMELIEHTLRQKQKMMDKNQVKFLVIGDRSRFSSSLRTLIEDVEHQTRDHCKIQFTIALNYGSRDEIKRAFQRMQLDFKGNFHEIGEAEIEAYLDTAGLPPIDMLIRTSNETRVSNFLLWQIAYAELFFENTLWPDFDSNRFEELLQQYAQRQRRIGT